MDNKKTHFCEACNFNTFNRADYIRHCKTNKHFLNCNKNNGLMDNKKTQKNALSWSCECGKKYKFQSGLCKHKKVCNFAGFNISRNENLPIHNDLQKNDLEEINSSKENNNEYKNLIIKLLEENKEFKTALIEQQKQIVNLLPKLCNNVTNNINNNLNINIFLRESCKDALNINDFINNIELTHDELRFAKKRGLSAGISKVFIENINKLSLYDRPLHCTDLKHEVLYVKDNDNWEQDNDKSKIKKAIKDISIKHFKTLQKWTEDNPDFKKIEKKKDEFVEILSTVSQDTSNLDNTVIKKLCNTCNINTINDN